MLVLSKAALHYMKEAAFFYSLTLENDLSMEINFENSLITNVFLRLIEA